MSLRPGLPERGSDADELKDIKRRLEALETAARLPLASIGEGGVTVLPGGEIRFIEADGSELMVLDSTRLLFNRSNGSRILEVTPGGLIIYAANGTTEVVELNGTGLFIDGIQQPALELVAGSDTANPTVTTSLVTVNQVDLTIPPWADEVILYTFARLQVSNVSGSNQNMTNQLLNDINGVSEITDDGWTIEHNQTTSSFVALTTSATPATTISCAQRVQTTGSSHSAEARLEVLAICRRTS